MKIGAGILPPPAAPRRPQAAENGLGAAGGLESRAARFAEFGMFGDPEPGRAPRPDGRRPRTALLGPPPEPGPAQKAEPQEIASFAAPRDAPDRPGPAAEAPPVAPAHWTQPVRRVDADVALAADGPAAEAPADAGAEVETPARPLRQAPVRTSTAPSLSLALREENGAVSIVAAAGPIDPDSRLLLRRLVETMLARSGLALAHFRLNGAPLAPTPIAKRGN